MRKLMIKLLFKLLTVSQSTVSKISDVDEFNAFLFNSSYDTEKMLKSRITIQMQRYWELDSEYVKAVAFAYQNILNNHRKATTIAAKEKNQAKRIVAWKKVKE